MGRYTDEPGAPEGIGGLLFRAVTGLVIIASGTWVGYAVYPKIALAMGAVGVLAIVLIVAWRASRLHTRTG
jgi:hypothetical protein